MFCEHCKNDGGKEAKPEYYITLPTTKATYFYCKPHYDKLNKEERLNYPGTTHGGLIKALEDMKLKEDKYVVLIFGLLEEFPESYKPNTYGPYSKEEADKMINYLTTKTVYGRDDFFVCKRKIEMKEIPTV